MTQRNVVFKARLESEMEELDIIVKRAFRAWQSAIETKNDLFLDAVALNLHGFYAGVERIFELISKDIDQAVPSGNAWHREMLNQMTMDIEGIRPAVISKTTQRMLDEYRGFRHVVRNVYAYVLSEERLKALVEGLLPCFSRFREELDGLMVQIS